MFWSTLSEVFLALDGLQAIHYFHLTVIMREPQACLALGAGSQLIPRAWQNPQQNMQRQGAPETMSKAREAHQTRGDSAAHTQQLEYRADLQHLRHHRKDVRRDGVTGGRWTARHDHENITSTTAARVTSYAMCCRSSTTSI